MRSCGEGWGKSETPAKSRWCVIWMGYGHGQNGWSQTTENCSSLEHSLGSTASTLSLILVPYIISTVADDAIIVRRMYRRSDE
uniref:C-type lectin domain-containing protein n=1 Tax=Ascaris lumbricoides TaxID=6252 RepID=A0A0M3HYL6_ASCLU